MDQQAKLLPKTFMDSYKPIGETIRVFNIPVPDLSKDEMIAVIGQLGKELEYQRKINERSSEFYKAVLERRKFD